MSKDSKLLSSLGNSEANYPSSIPTPTINTPSSSPLSRPSSRRGSPFPTKTRQSPPPKRTVTFKSSVDEIAAKATGDTDLEEGEGEMGDLRSPLHRPNDGRSHVPLLKEERSSYDMPNGSTRPARRTTFQSRTPDMEGSSAVKKKYAYASFFLILSLVTFVIQTETASYIQHELKWNKAYAMLCVCRSDSSKLPAYTR